MAYFKEWFLEINKHPDKLQFWKRLLGDGWNRLEYEDTQWIENILQKIHESFRTDGQSQLWDGKVVYAHEKIYRILKDDICKSDIAFLDFYNPWMDWVFTNLMQMDIAHIYTKQCQSEILKICGRRFNEIACRTLINDMNIRKREGLCGDTPQEEYVHYCKTFLSQTEYHQNLCRTYPVLVQLLDQASQDLMIFFDEIRQHLQQDKNKIIEQLCHQIPFENIEDIECGIADVHNGGRTVAKLHLDNGRVIFYKPHAMQQDRIFLNTYQWFCETLGLEVRSVHMLIRKNYAWVEEIKYAECQSTEEIQLFYKRLGVWMFCCYILSVGDMHYENMIASGAYPMIIDMETVPGIILLENTDTVQKYGHWMDAKIASSVLMTHLLPLFAEEQNGYNENVSAIGAKNGQILSLSIPVIEHPLTSDMCIVYKHPVIQNNHASPRFHGQYVQEKTYMKDLLDGFKLAYRTGINQREQLLKMVEPLFDMKARVVLRDTQEYQMVKMLATYPMFLTSPENRVMLLLTLKKQHKFSKEIQCQILTDEILNLYMQYVPVYWHQGNNIYTSSQSIIKKAISVNAKHLFEHKIEQLGENDCCFQNQLIEMSMSMIGKDGYRYMNTTSITEEILRRCVSRPQLHRLGWMNLSINHTGKCQIMLADMYLYDGICGVLVYIAAYLYCRKLFNRHCAQNQNKENLHQMGINYKSAESLFNRLVKQIYEYTDQQLSEVSNTTSLHTGIMTGESSVVYTYLLLYKMTGNPEFTAYAKKHMTILEKIWYMDTNYDMLSGNAGLIIACMHMYEITGNMMYVTWAEDIAVWLLNKSMKQIQGIGWKIPECDYPLAGLAHGCSGFLLAFTRLYKVTKNLKWKNCIKEILAYENSLFNAAYVNWNDLRNMSSLESQEFYDFSAWCHGAPGIAIVRQEMSEIFKEDDCLYQILQKNIADAKKKIKQTKSERSCLCHGTMGIRHIKNEMTGEHRDKYCGKSVNRDTEKAANDKGLKKEVCISEREWYNNGFMTGICGIGYELLYQENSDLPDVLRLKIE